jgi:hypothetical protein
MYVIILINGVYDIFCAYSILYDSKNIFSTLHAHVFKVKNIKDDLHRRLLGYWILTYGLMRLFFKYKVLIYISYGIEMFMFFNEGYIHKTAKLFEVNFILLSSIIMVYLTYLY